MDDYNATDNSVRCYELALSSMREMKLRSGEIEPRPDDEWEQRWARDGVCRIQELDSLRFVP